MGCRVTGCPPERPTFNVVFRANYKGTEKRVVVPYCNKHLNEARKFGIEFWGTVISIALEVAFGDPVDVQVEFET